LYNEVESLPELQEWISKVMENNNLTYELIFIDDGSKDGSWNVVENLQKQNQFIR
jgi:glycosyltransferase involved in cell wall biosynthesis